MLFSPGEGGSTERSRLCYCSLADGSTKRAVPHSGYNGCTAVQVPVLLTCFPALLGPTSNSIPGKDQRRQIGGKKEMPLRYSEQNDATAFNWRFNAPERQI